MKKSFISFLILAASPAIGWCQFGFSNHSSLLGNDSIRSGAPVGVADMNADGLDDIVRLDEAMVVNIDYQDPVFPFFSTQAFDLLSGYQWGMCIADVDGNGYNDIFAGGAYNGLQLLTANANGTSYSAATLPGNSIFMQTANFADIDGDGDSDIFACHDDGVSQAYRNDGSGNFVQDNTLIDAVSTVPSDNSGNYGSVWIDYDNDRDLDLYISKCRQGVNNPNDGRRLNLLFRNNGNHTFTEVAAEAGLQPRAQSWASDFADIDNDGDLDCFVINHDIPNKLYANNGAGQFTDITPQSGLIPATNTSAGLQCKFADFDNDGYVDLLYTAVYNTHYLFRNNGDHTFTNLTAAIPSSDRIHTAAIGDLNNDGAIDIIAGFGVGYNGFSDIPDKLFINNVTGNQYLKVLLTGVVSNPNGIGARLELYGPWGVMLREVRSGESYGIMNSLTQHFGLAEFPIIDSLKVFWPSGVVDKIINPGFNQTLRLMEGSACEGTVSFAADADGLAVSFFDESSIGTNAWLWDFGDGTTSTEQFPVHEYSEADSYEVCLTAVGICGSDQVCQPVIVCEAPQPIFGASVSALTISFEDQSLGSPTDWHWSFGDGTSSFEQHPEHNYELPGTYLVCLRTSNNCGFNEVCEFITISCGATEANFTYEASELNVQFTDNSTSDATNWAWDFGDGGAATLPDPEHAFAAPGQYQVCLTVTGSCDTETTCILLTVGCAAPAVDFDFIANGLMIAFIAEGSATIASWSWDFGDGNTSDMVNPLHIFPAPGAYEVCLTATSICGMDQFCQTIEVSCEPAQADYTYEADELTLGFTDNTPGNPTAWFWTFGDGMASDQQNPTHTFALPGDYNVCLEMTDSCGSSLFCETIAVSCNPPEAGFSFELNEFTVVFTDTSTGAPNNWDWDFGDGTTSSEQHPEHTYASPGAYEVCLGVENDCGSDQFCTLVIINCLAPQADFTYTTAGLEVSFTDISTNDPTAWSWSFSDGGTSLEQNPVYTYAEPGEYEVCLKAFSICGQTIHCEMIIVTCPAPAAAFEFTADRLDLQFTDLSVEAPTEWLWTFGDGNSSTEQNPAYTYPEAGDYEVCLTTGNDCGSTVHCQTITVNCPAPIAQFSITMNDLQVSLTDSSLQEPVSWFWDLGNGFTTSIQHPEFTYSEAGEYEICLTVTNGCGSDTHCDTINIIVATNDPLILGFDFVPQPNPVADLLRLEFSGLAGEMIQLKVHNAVGQFIEMYQWQLANERDHRSLKSSHWPDGVYLLSLETEAGKRLVKKIVKKG